jgi:hypothetical protein
MLHDHDEFEHDNSINKQLQYFQNTIDSVKLLIPDDKYLELCNQNHKLFKKYAKIIKTYGISDNADINSDGDYYTDDEDDIDDEDDDEYYQIIAQRLISRQLKIEKKETKLKKKNEQYKKRMNDLKSYEKQFSERVKKQRPLLQIARYIRKINNNNLRRMIIRTKQ